MKAKKAISITLAALLAAEIHHSPWDLVNNQPHTHQDTDNHNIFAFYFDPPGLTTSASSSYLHNPLI